MEHSAVEPRVTRTPEEKAQTERFEAYYDRAQAPVLRSIERQVCGCDYGGTSWTTRDEAERIGTLLGLWPGRRLLDIGSGSGWPGLYLAQTSGADITLTDLPLAGLQIAVERSARDRLAGACWAAAADAARLPFADASFDAVCHSDVLCCLIEKRAVLRSCRRVIRPGGAMVFSVISMAPDLSPADHRRALDAGPEFIEAEADYRTLLEETGWTVHDRQDLTAQFALSCRGMLRADAEQGDALQAVVGAGGFAERAANWRRRAVGAETGLIRRELFLAQPETV